MSEETKLFLPAVTGPLQTGNIQIGPTYKTNIEVQPVPDRCDLPNSAK